MTFQYTIAFFIGLQATLHCVGMCGPLAMAAPIQRDSKRSALWGSLSYNLGRISTYTYLGFVIGLLGISALWLHTIQVLSITSGLLFMSAAFFGSPENWPLLKPLTQKIGKLSTFLFPALKKVNPALRPYLFGVVNGLLPCGMVYLGLFHAISGTNILEVVLSMLCFGLGTLPVMFFIPLIGQQRFYQLFPKYTQKILLFAIGLLLTLRGLGLGIPYLSPKMNLPAPNHSQPSVECCEVQK